MLTGIMLISNIRENGEPIGALPDGEMMFHHDNDPSRGAEQGHATLSVEIPTMAARRCSRAAMPAYETLDPELCTASKQARAHHYNYGQQNGTQRWHRSLHRMGSSGVPHA